MDIYGAELRQIVHSLRELEKEYTVELTMWNEKVKGNLILSREKDCLRYFQAWKQDGRYFRKGITRKQETVAQLCRNANVDVRLIESEIVNKLL